MFENIKDILIQKPKIQLNSLNTNYQKSLENFFILFKMSDFSLKMSDKTLPLTASILLFTFLALDIYEI